jgi:hypothetical protein
LDTATYVKRLLIPNGKKPTGRKVWSIDLETVWIPFFTATNTTGDTAIEPDALGCPLRLAYEKDGSVKFSQAGKPVIRVSKALSDNIRLIRENFTATIIAHYEGVQEGNPDGYAQQVELNRKAGEPIFQKDRENLDRANAERMERHLAELEAKAEPQPAEPQPAEPVKSKGKSKDERELATVS